MPVPPPSIDEMQQKMCAFLEATPFRDAEKNFRSFVESMFASSNWAQKSEINALSQLVEKMAERLYQLEERVKKLESLK